MNAPCRGCGKRTEECHAKCAEYARFRAGVERVREKRTESQASVWTEIDRHRKQRKDQGWSMKRDERR